MSGNIQAIAPYRQCNAVLLCWHARLVACLDQWAVFVEGSARCSLTVSGWHMMDLPIALLCGYTEGALDMVFCNVCVQGQGIHKRKAWQGLPLASDLQPLLSNMLPLVVSNSRVCSRYCLKQATSGMYSTIQQQ